MIKTTALWLSLVLAVLGSAGSALAEDLAVGAQWAPAPVTIDGFDSEWAGTRMAAAEDGMAEIGMKNDGTFLYVLFAVKNPKFLTNIGATGLTVYFSPAGKKSKDRGLKLVRRAIPTEIYIESMEKSGTALTPEKKAELRTKPYYVIFHCEVLGYKPPKDAPAAALDPAVAPVYAAIGTPNFVIYECRIPLSREAHPGGIGIEPGKPVKIGFEWGGSVKDAKGKIRAGQNPGLGDTTSETPEAQNEAYSEGGGLDDIQLRKKSPKKYAFWADVTLAAQ